MAEPDPVPSLVRMDRRREPISSEVAQILVRHLLGGDYQPGQRLPSERMLAESLGVGRSVVREALKSLTLLGLVQVRPGDGTYLQSRGSDLLPVSFEWGLLLGDHQLQDVIEARTELEVMLAALAAERRTDEDARELEVLLRAMREATSSEAFVSADVAFHLRVAKAARNSIFEQMLIGIQSLQRFWITRVIDSAPSREPSYSDHVPILAAISAGDVAAAREAMRDHLNHAAGRLRRAIETRSDEARGKDSAHA